MYTVDLVSGQDFWRIIESFDTDQLKKSRAECMLYARRYDRWPIPDCI